MTFFSNNFLIRNNLIQCTLYYRVLIFQEFGDATRIPCNLIVLQKLETQQTICPIGQAVWSSAEPLQMKRTMATHLLLLVF